MGPAPKDLARVASFLSCRPGPFAAKRKVQLASANAAAANTRRRVEEAPFETIGQGMALGKKSTTRFAFTSRSTKCRPTTRYSSSGGSLGKLSRRVGGVVCKG